MYEGMIDVETVVPNPWPAGQKWPAKPQNVARGTRQINKKKIKSPCFLNFQFVLSDFNFRQALCTLVEKTCFYSCIIEFCTRYCTTCFIECQMLPNALGAGYINWWQSHAAYFAYHWTNLPCPPLDQTESAMADLAGPRKINFVCMKLYMQFVYKLAIQPHYFYLKKLTALQSAFSGVHSWI